jgi:hypothetical protein
MANRHSRKEKKVTVSEIPQTDNQNSAPKSKRGRKPGTQPKVRLGIPEEFFQFTELNEQETAESRRKREPRTDAQKNIDKIFLDLWNLYIERNEPKNWADKPVYAWGPIPKTYEEDAMFMVRKAAQLYGRRQIFGERTYSEKDGVEYVTIPFSVERRVEKTTTKTED